MSSHARRYIERAPRYVLRPQDRTIMRFKGDSLGKPVQADVVNLSETGLSFSIDSDEFPELHEVLMVEFTIPGKRQIACYASVVRIETHEDWHPAHGNRSTLRVALEFHTMPFAFRRVLKESLNERVQNEDDFDEVLETKSMTPALSFALATLGLLMLLQTVQIPPHKWVEIFF